MAAGQPVKRLVGCGTARVGACVGPGGYMESGDTAGALEGVRLLDLSSPLANFAARLFAGLGADVIKVERRDGDPLRRREPFWHGKPDADGSLEFIVNNLN